MKKIKENYIQYIKKYLATNILVFLATISMLFKSISIIPLILFMDAIITFCVETIFLEKRKRIIGIIFAAVASIILNVLPRFFSYSRYVSNISYWVSAIIGLFGIYKVIKNSKIEFSNYVIRVFENIFKAGIIYIILEIGINVLILIFYELILGDIKPSLVILTKVQYILFGFFLIPTLLYSITNVKNEASKVLKNIIKFVVMPLIVMFYLIIYIYILKILITKQMPKNIIFALFTVIFTISYFIWTIFYSFKKEKHIYKISKIMPIAFIPLLILQIYSLLLRIIPYGLTHQRYLGLMITVFEIFAIIFSLIKRRKYENKIIFVTIGIIIITYTVPYINMYELSKISQDLRLKEENIPEQIDLNSKVKAEEITSQNGTTGKTEKNEYIYYYGENVESNAGVSLPDGFKTIKQGQIYTEEAKTTEEGIDYSVNGLKKESLENAITTYKDCNVNIYDYTRNIIDIYEKNGQEGIQKFVEKNMNLNTTSENIIFQITNIQIHYVENEKEIQNPIIKTAIYTGYFMYK